MYFCSPFTTLISASSDVTFTLLLKTYATIAPVESFTTTLTGQEIRVAISHADLSDDKNVVIFFGSLETSAGLFIAKLPRFLFFIAL